MRAFSLNLVVQDDSWTEEQQEIEDLCNLITDTVLKTLNNTPSLPIELPADRSLDLSLILMDDEGIKSINRKYRNKDQATTVLSFPTFDAEELFALDEGENLPLGDIFMSRGAVDRQAQERRKTFKDHFAHLFVHGCLHLFHYDHETDEDAAVMEKLETQILEALGIQSPYEDVPGVSARPIQ